MNWTTSRQTTPNHSKSQANSNIVNFHPVAREYDKRKREEEAFSRRARRDAGKSQQVLGYAILAILLAFICGLTAIAFSQVPSGY